MTQTAQPTSLAAVIHELCNPRVDILDRAGADDPDVAQLAADHRAAMDRLRVQHAELMRRPRQAAQARRVLARLIDLERRWQAGEEARRTARGEQPSLLDQLCDAVESSQGGGRRSTSQHRSPIGLAAAELLTDIERTAGRGPRDQLARRVWTWAAGRGTDPDAIELAATWVASARDVLNPSRPLDLVAACPVCGARTAHVDDAGEMVRRAALQLDRVSGWARCIAPRCGAEWPPSRLALLAAVLEQQADDRLAACPA